MSEKGGREGEGEGRFRFTVRLGMDEREGRKEGVQGGREEGLEMRERRRGKDGGRTEGECALVFTVFSPHLICTVWLTLRRTWAMLPSKRVSTRKRSLSTPRHWQCAHWQHTPNNPCITG